MNLTHVKTEKIDMPPYRDPVIRFWEKVSFKEDGCMIWIASKNADGYGTFWDQGCHLAHRWIYEKWYGKVPDDLQLDHLCRIYACVNPDHLEAVTPKVNVVRSDSIPAINGRKTYCSKGHEFTPENTYYNKRGGRWCRICGRAYSRRWKEKNRF